MSHSNTGKYLSLILISIAAMSCRSARASLTEFQCSYSGGSEDSHGRYLGLNAPNVMTILNPESDEPILLVTYERHFFASAPSSGYSPHLKGNSTLNADRKTRTFVFNSWYTPNELCNDTTCYDKRIGFTVTVPADYATESVTGFAAESQLLWGQRPHPVAGGAILPSWFTAWPKSERFQLNLSGCVVR